MTAPRPEFREPSREAADDSLKTTKLLYKHRFTHIIIIRVTNYYCRYTNYFNIVRTFFIFSKRWVLWLPTWVRPRESHIIIILARWNENTVLKWFYRGIESICIARPCTTESGAHSPTPVCVMCRYNRHTDSS